MANDNQQVGRGLVRSECSPACQCGAFIVVDGPEGGAVDAEFLPPFIGEVEGIGFVGEILPLASAILARIQACMNAFRMGNFGYRDNDFSCVFDTIPLIATQDQSATSCYLKYVTH